MSGSRGAGAPEGEGPVRGLHHVTLMTRRAQANVDFYVGFLGLRLVKRTAGFEDAAQLHLFYGDRDGLPGSLVTFLVWEDGAPGRSGTGQWSEFALAIPPDSIGFWLTRCLSFGVAHQLPSREFGEPVLRLTDPDGIVVKLIGTSAVSSQVVSPAAGETGAIASGYAVRGLRGASVLSANPDETEDFLVRHFGLARHTIEGGARRLLAATGHAVDVRDGRGFWSGAAGTGTIDHLAFASPDASTLEAARAALAAGGSGVTPIKDRRYFRSVYVREPGGALLEVATDGPGMTVDESPGRLGTELFVPPGLEEKEEALRLALPQIALPGEERDVSLDLSFVHRLNRPDDPDGSIFVLLHGTGGDETDLMPLARAIAPRATLLGIRGRSTEEGVLRWFRRLTPTLFDQEDVRSEAEAFADFLPRALRGYDLAPERVSFLGYSNGANFIAALMLLQPGLVRQAILLRAMLVVEAPPQTNLDGTSVLSVAGNADPYGPYAASLVKLLTERGAGVDGRIIEAGHMLEPQDAVLARSWLATHGE